ncbi:type II toxin-antitoxin system antitoxin SocA domain-containing protein [Paenisporosarcina macmurdoensis]|uniref:Type II toxin-antitoxin system antitoxin SocA domain-containing protein n=1 Tax=Paenisporosarcina macmurdoensis TaxID=212659 RepID=A0ABW1LAM7_9BACL
MLPFCEHCEDVVVYDITPKTKQKTIKGKEISYLAKEAHCHECGSLMFIPEVHDHNLNQINEAYRAVEKLITVPEIEKAVEMFGIGKRPLSLALGWGEGTLTRYLDGQMPTKQYSLTLKKVIADPEYMVELLELNKDKINESTYTNCKQTILELKKRNLECNSGNQKKIDSVVQYLLYKCVEITPLALQKLLYYSQAFNYTINKEFLFEDDCEAWVHGPVYKTIYEKYKGYGYNPIEEELNVYNFRLLTNDEKNLLDSIVNNFGCYSGKVLEDMTHIESPWKDMRKGLRADEPSNRIISKTSIENYFKEIKNKHSLVNVSDIRDYSTDIFQKIH